MPCVPSFCSIASSKRDAKNNLVVKFTDTRRDKECIHAVSFHASSETGGCYVAREDFHTEIKLFTTGITGHLITVTYKYGYT